MTRFARAKGSKSSNLKAPEDGTPWEVMKEQMLKAKKDNEESKKFKEAEQQRINNYENFLKERRVEKRKAEWCDFPETQNKKSNNDKNSKSAIENKNKKSDKSKTNESESDIKPDATEVVTKNKKNKKKNKSKNKTQNGNSNGIQGTMVSQDQPIGNDNAEESVINEIISEEKANNSDKSNAHPAGNDKKKKKNKNKTKYNQDTAPKPVEASQNDPSNGNTNNPSLQTDKKTNKKNGNKPVRRKEINDQSFKLIINGKDIELVRFDGFPIMKRDAERLQELKNNMIKKGIPKSEVQRTLKLERRRAEKALARLKRDVCYNCRKGGHNLSDCPDLRSNIPGVDSADGVCFKCGSTEHRQNECKVQRDKEFRFATCFICREPGHLARQCPDNPKGLYPNGGCCKLCGDVTHLRKDCPTVDEKKEGTSIKLPTLDTLDNIEDIGLNNKPATVEEAAKKPKKIKF